jgi:hypothetical protein
MMEELRSGGAGEDENGRRLGIDFLCNTILG